MRLLGVDPGSRRIGIAFSDGGIAFPRTTVDNGPGAVRAIGEIARAENIEALVVGLPLRLDGRESDAARRARKLATALEAETGLPVHLWDERLSTVSASRALREAGLSAKAQRKVVDQAAAVVILQGFVDARAARERGDERTSEGESESAREGASEDERDDEGR